MESTEDKSFVKLLKELILLNSMLKKDAVFLEDVALIWSFWDMMDMSKVRLLVQFRFRVQNLLFDVISR